MQKFGEALREEIGSDPTTIRKRLPKLRLLFEYLDLATGGFCMCVCAHPGRSPHFRLDACLARSP